MRTRFLLPALLIVPVMGVVAQPGPFPEADLIYARNICSDTAFAFPNLLAGDVQDLGPMNRGCLASNERNGSWAIFEVATAGTIGFTLTPSLPQTDLDFALWGPVAQWPNVLVTQPIRCSYAATDGATGLGGSAVDVSEAATGDGWVSRISVNAGDHFVLFVDNWAINGAEAELVWELLGGATLTCLELPNVFFGVDSGDIPPGGTVAVNAYPTPDVYAFYWQLPGSTIGTSTDQEILDVQYDIPGCYDVTLTMYNAAGENTGSLSCVVSVVLPTGLVEPFSTSAISVDGDHLWVQPFGKGACTVFVMDPLGRTLVQRSGAGRLDIGLTELHGSVVIVVVEQEGSKQVHRLMLP